MSLVLCRVGELDATGAKGVTLGEAPDWRDIVVLRCLAGIRAYENRCPHQRTTLETFPDRFLDESREIVICTMHGARFRSSDGECIFGPCKGQRLQPVAIRIEGDEVILPDGA